MRFDKNKMELVDDKDPIWNWILVLLALAFIGVVLIIKSFINFIQ
jgi:hypothetical protein